MMKKLFALLLSVCILLCLVACGTSVPNKQNSQSQTENNKDTKLYPLNTNESVYSTYSDIPEIIFSTTGEENGLRGTIYSFSGKMIEERSKLGSSYFVVETKYGEVLMMNVYNDVKDSIPVDEECYTTPEIGEIARFTCIYAGFSSVEEMPAFTYGNDDFLLSSYSDSNDAAEAINTTDNEKTPSIPEETQKPAETTKSQETQKPTEISISKQNALKSAKSYLNYSAFSYLGLISQLEYEKFSHEDAVYAADNCGADWNQQALMSAKSYLNYSAFSYSGLIKQLEYEKFTSEQAKYGADNCGADWNEQAAKSAKSYLDFSSFSRQGLIDQLEYEGFTHEQAVYGVNSVGL